MLNVKPREIWKPINNYPNYEVGNLGRIKRITSGANTFPGKILKPIKKRDGYFVVNMHSGRKIKEPKKMIFVSKLVADAFLGPRPDGYEVNHKDGNKANNNRYNLEYITHANNLKHAIRLGLRKIKLTREDLEKIRLLYVNSYGSLHKIAKEFGVNRAQVSRIIDRTHSFDELGN